MSGMKRRMFLKISLGLAGAAAAAVGVWSSAVVYLEKRSYQKSRKYRLPPREGKKDPKILVLCFSRSGATELMARKMALDLGADLIKLKAPAYRLGYLGWVNAMWDVYSRAKAKISPGRLNLAQYNLVLLGTPIWLYKLSPPLWTFVRGNDFRGRRVVLFHTYNSNFSEEEIDKFKKTIVERGGKYVDHVYILRNRILDQISSQELVARAGMIVRERKKVWLGRNWGGVLKQEEGRDV